MCNFAFLGERKALRYNCDQCDTHFRGLRRPWLFGKVYRAKLAPSWSIKGISPGERGLQSLEPTGRWLAFHLDSSWDLANSQVSIHLFTWTHIYISARATAPSFLIIKTCTSLKALRWIVITQISFGSFLLLPPFSCCLAESQEGNSLMPHGR